MRIGGLQKFTLSDFPGTPAAIIFTQGCNFRCPFCHNGGLLPDRGDYEITEEALFDWLGEKHGKLEGVVISGGEPTLHDDLPDFLAEIRTRGYKVKLDTNGSRPDMLGHILEHNLVDFIAMDIKAPWHKYNLLCGTEVDCRAIQESVKIIAKSIIGHLFRTTFATPLLSQDDIQTVRTSLPQGSVHIIQAFKKELAWCPSFFEDSL